MYHCVQDIKNALYGNRKAYDSAETATDVSQPVEQTSGAVTNADQSKLSHYYGVSSKAM